MSSPAAVNGLMPIAALPTVRAGYHSLLALGILYLRRRSESARLTVNDGLRHHPAQVRRAKSLSVRGGNTARGV
jgi:hypothetical protein